MEGLRSHSPSTSVGTATEGATPSQSLPPFAAKSKFRPLSAPPGRLDCHNRFLREGSPFKARRDREAGTGSAAISGMINYMLTSFPLFCLYRPECVKKVDKV